MGQVFKWILAEGGLDAMRERNEAKAAVVYDFLDSQDFYIPHAEKDSRSLMNITFKCPTPEFDKLFIAGREEGARRSEGPPLHRRHAGEHVQRVPEGRMRGARVVHEGIRPRACEYRERVSARRQ
jgi:phosphoserine aminotransferase